MDMNALPKTNYIKTIVTAEAKLDLERKGVQSYQRDIYARFLCFGNGALTSLYDHSDGFFRRQLILTTKDKPADRTDDPFLVEKMCTELEGILLWCLEGLHRLVQNDFRFTVSERAAANVDTIKRSSNNVIDFMESEGYFRFKADYSISSKEFYDIYKQWCEDNACHSVSAIRFSAELRQNDRRYNLEATNNIYLPGGRRVRGFVGIEPLVPVSYTHLDVYKRQIVKARLDRCCTLIEQGLPITEVYKTSGFGAVSYTHLARASAICWSWLWPVSSPISWTATT